ncbi:MAG: hypothetical protein BGO55_11750 [Sphingobacteriales bacterium 50-39]|nr:hypothetical protein [Sphingobacteriales bacterium]OJW54361.1 MAG: hypothetical protein BGO55_11750 [Sphingobacteriales bacterium 50-39]
MDDPGKYYDANRRKLEGIDDSQWTSALKKCQEHLRIKLKRRATFGAHAEKRLGEDPFDYYTHYAYNAIISGNWEWKEGRTLAQQMILIIDSTMSTEVEKTRTGKEPEMLNGNFDDYFYSDEPLPDEFEFTKEILINKQISVLEEAIKGDQDLEVYWECIKDKMKRAEIAAFMEITVKKQDKLREKLIDKVRQSPYFEM